MNERRVSGIATVMFTDVEASTDITTRLGDDAAASLFATHDKIVRDQVTAHGGRDVRSTGDGFLVVFDSARAAVSCALSIQRGSLSRRGRSECGSVSMQRAAGGGWRALRRDGQPCGTREGPRERRRGPDDRHRPPTGRHDDGCGLRDRGRVVLKGFPERQRLYEVRPADDRPDRPPRARRASRPSWRTRGLLVAAVLSVADQRHRRGADPLGHGGQGSSDGRGAVIAGLRPSGRGTVRMGLEQRPGRHRPPGRRGRLPERGCRSRTRPAVHRHRARHRRWLAVGARPASRRRPEDRSPHARAHAEDQTGRDPSAIASAPAPCGRELGRRLGLAPRPAHERRDAGDRGRRRAGRARGWRRRGVGRQQRRRHSLADRPAHQPRHRHDPGRAPAAGDRDCRRRRLGDVRR
jgi:Adenylate and Guanylate cyclase catalytic domain